MGEHTAIEWTDATWNPWRGCHKVSQGCKNCYMFRDQVKYGNDPNVVMRSKTTFNDPLKWARKSPLKQMKVFACSWSDWFIEEADPWRDEAWDIIRKTPNFTYQILTKRAESIHYCLPDDWGNGWPNVWLGVSVENRENVWRLEALSEIPAVVRFMSYEPALSTLDATITTFSPILDWVIVGGESGPNYRPLNLEWVFETVYQCRDNAIACFVKQDSGLRSGNQGRIPDELWIKEFPSKVS